MRSFIIHTPTGSVLDFAEPDAFCQEVVADIVRRERRGEYRNHRTLPEELICYSHRNEKMPYVYLQERPGGLIVAAHWQGSGLAGNHEIAYHGMSDEHRRQAECWANGATKAGNRADLEVWSPNQLVRNDVVIFGPAVEMAVEVQRSGLAIPAAKSRNTKTRREGREPLWAIALSPRCAQHGVFLKQLVPGKLYCPICHRSEMNACDLTHYPTPA